MRFGFVIDNRRCIGCHACSTACKSENEVPLGVSRTWVKYTETGRYPDVRRHFQVTRCNHCENPPCVRICPVTAMYQRDDGIVEFDPEVCIGCKACIQACPYDAIHLDPDTGTAAKCHYCSHRTDLGLEPACVVVCPEHAIIAGDMDDPESEIARTLAKETVVVRKPEQGTAPKLFYVDGNAASLHPTAVPLAPEKFMYTEPLERKGAGLLAERSDRPDGGADPYPSRDRGGGRSKSGAAIQTPGPQGLPSPGPITMGGRLAEQMIQVGYNAQHRIYWHWQVPAYVVTKDVATGLFMLLTALFGTGLVAYDAPVMLYATTAALVFTLITTALLVFDLEKPERFLSIVLRPQWRSWLARGAFLLIGFTGVLGLSWLLEAAQGMGWLQPGDFGGLRIALLWLGAPLAFMTAVYTAFLFGQAEGRDLWQHPLLPLQFFVRSVVAGAALLALAPVVVATPEGFASLCLQTFAGALAVDLALTLFGELAMPHATETAAVAAKKMVKGPYKTHFWVGALAVGHVLPLLLAWLPPLRAAWPLAPLAALLGLFFMEYAFVMAAQKVPNS